MDTKRAGVRLSVNADLMTWFAVHAHVSLGLRHPENRGPSTRFTKAFVRELGQRLVDEGRSAMDAKRAGVRLSVNADLMTWFAVHGNAILGLRHPENRGPSTRFTKALVRELGQRLVDEGLITADELADIEKDIPP